MSLKDWPLGHMQCENIFQTQIKQMPLWCHVNVNFSLNALFELNYGAFYRSGPLFKQAVSGRMFPNNHSRMMLEFPYIKISPKFTDVSVAQQIFCSSFNRDSEHNNQLFSLTGLCCGYRILMCHVDINADVSMWNSHLPIMIQVYNHNKIESSS